ncbi:PilN domain-containing protein [Candidatus Falkowbacteria bacterium]|nr:PilN domain-containing protein [Candidatus Falkowbacteria bacterium]
MLTLNLISEELKKEIKLRHLYLFIKKINLTLIILTIIIAIILLAAKTILQIKFNDIVDQTTLVTKNNQGYNNKVKDINSKIDFVEKIQGDFIPWSNLLKTIADITPEDISLYYLKINFDEQTIKIKGKAGLRDSLLDFKQKMENISILKDIDFPIKNILEKENINFEIDAKINLTSLL